MKILGWKPFKNGRNFQIFDAKIENGTIYSPYLSKREYYREAVKFWLHDLSRIEARSIRKKPRRFKQDLIVNENQYMGMESIDFSFLAFICVIFIFFIVFLWYWKEKRVYNECEKSENLKIISVYGTKYV